MRVREERKREKESVRETMRENETTLGVAFV